MTDSAATTNAGVQRLLHTIDGAMVEPADGAFFPVYEPATGAVYAEVPVGSAADADRAIAAAQRAFPGWRDTPTEDRSRLMLRLADLIEANHERLAAAESRDTGKPISLASAVDIPRAAANIRFFATAILHTSSPSYLQNAANGRFLHTTVRAPRGVAACISPWNLPLYLFTWKLAPALATGNTVVGKPSEITPMTATILGELSIEAGFPPGVLNIVHGKGPAIGAPLIEDPRVPTVTFTGGTATGKAIAAAAAPQFKSLSLELGGKNPAVVFADCDWEETLAGVTRAAFANQGQICLCGSRILVEQSIFDTFVAEYVRRVEDLVVGDPSDPATQFGAVVSAEQLAKVESYVALAKEEGGTIQTGGERVDPAALSDRVRGGWFYKPTVVTGLGPQCRVDTEEIFGPVVTIQPFANEAEAIQLANAVEYGLAASIWTGSQARANRVAAGVEAGIVWVNCWMVRDLRIPFGGMKASGVGREGGEAALQFFTEPKSICTPF